MAPAPTTATSTDSTPPFTQSLPRQPSRVVGGGVGGRSDPEQREQEGTSRNDGEQGQADPVAREHRLVRRAHHERREEATQPPGRADDARHASDPFGWRLPGHPREHTTRTESEE